MSIFDNARPFGKLLKAGVVSLSLLTVSASVFAPSAAYAFNGGGGSEGGGGSGGGSAGGGGGGGEAMNGSPSFFLSQPQPNPS